MLKGLTDLGVADTPRVAVDRLQVWQRWLTKARNTPTIKFRIYLISPTSNKSSGEESPNSALPNGVPVLGSEK